MINLKLMRLRNLVYGGVIAATSLIYSPSTEGSVIDDRVEVGGRYIAFGDRGSILSAFLEKERNLNLLGLGLVLTVATASLLLSRYEEKAD